MLRCLAKWIVILALTSSIGLHWALFQSVAWVSMLAGNLQKAAFSQAVQLTFDGQHPCSLCKAIARGKKSEKKAEFPSPIKKLEFLSSRASQLPDAPTRFSLVRTLNRSALSRAQAPPSPPPRRPLV